MPNIHPLAVVNYVMEDGKERNDSTCKNRQGMVRERRRHKFMDIRCKATEKISLILSVEFQLT